MHNISEDYVVTCKCQHMSSTIPSLCHIYDKNSFQSDWFGRFHWKSARDKIDIPISTNQHSDQNNLIHHHKKIIRRHRTRSISCVKNKLRTNKPLWLIFKFRISFSLPVLLLLLLRINLGQKWIINIETRDFSK